MSADVVTSGARRRLVVALTFSVFPARGGGQVRVLHLYRRLARWFDVEIVSLVGPDDPELSRVLAPGLTEHTVPRSPRHVAAELALQRDAGTVVTDVAMVRLHELTPGYAGSIRRLAAGARAVVACHPYPYEAIRAATDAPLWYEAQDVEATLKASLLAGSDTAASLLADVERVEGACCRESEVMWTCSTEDRSELVARYGADPQHVHVVPNGVDTEEIRYVTPERRAALREGLRLAAGGDVLFVGSWHEPNIVAARSLVAAARRLPGTRFLILGSAGAALPRGFLPPNVDLLGSVEDGFKESVLAIASAAANPMSTGSGTNLKMLEYFAAGIPVISTPFGARGLDVHPGEHYVAADARTFAAGVRELNEMPAGQVGAMTQAARARVESHFSWGAIAGGLRAVLPV